MSHRFNSMQIEGGNFFLIPLLRMGLTDRHRIQRVGLRLLFVSTTASIRVILLITLIYFPVPMSKSPSNSTLRLHSEAMDGYLFLQDPFIRPFS